jgi:hypothetical protein
LVRLSVKASAANTSRPMPAAMTRYFSTEASPTSHDPVSNDDSGKKIISEALKAYQDDSYVDLVAKTIKDTNASVSATSLNEAASEENITSDSTDTNSSKTTTDSKENTDTKSNKYDVYIILGIFIVVIGGIAVLALTSNKQK